MCDKEGLAEISQTLLNVGMLLGALFFPSLGGM